MLATRVSATRRRFAQGVLWCALALPSLSLVHQHGGWWGGLAYVMLVLPVALWLGVPGRRCDPPLPAPSVLWLAAATWVAMVTGRVESYDVVVAAGNVCSCRHGRAGIVGGGDACGRRGGAG